MTSSHSFCRLLCTETMKDVRPLASTVDRKAAWAYRGDLGAEFHGPDGFYWSGDACCLWSAKASGWAEWVDQQEAQKKPKAAK